MTGDLDKLTNVYDTHLVMLEMPTGQSTVTSKCGRVQLNPTIILYNILYVPGLNYNLISAAQLVNELFCIVNFSNNLCIIQDLPTKKLNRVDEQ